MERKQTPLRYSDVKPAAKFARDHWSIPNVHEPWRGFEDKTPDKKLQLKAVRRQVLNYATYSLRHGESSADVVKKMDEMFLGDRRG